jgi:hypothetical protein
MHCCVGIFGMRGLMHPAICYDLLFLLADHCRLYTKFLFIDDYPMPFRLFVEKCLQLKR